MDTPCRGQAVRPSDDYGRRRGVQERSTIVADARPLPRRNRPLAAPPVSRSSRKASASVNKIARAEDMLLDYAVNVGAASTNDAIILPGLGVTIKETAEELFK